MAFDWETGHCEEKESWAGPGRHAQMEAKGPMASGPGFLLG